MKFFKYSPLVQLQTTIEPLGLIFFWLKLHNFVEDAWENEVHVFESNFKEGKTLL